VKNAEQFAQRVSLALTFATTLLFPITILLSQFAQFVSQKSGVKEEGLPLSEEELKVLLEVGEEKGALEEEEKEMIRSIFEFGKIQAREIMVPRIDMVCVEKNTSIEELVDIIKKKGHTRIPLYEEKVDNILGIVYAKDLLPHLQTKPVKVELTSLARPAYFVPESKLIDELLKEFQQEKIHMAIVVDEYGGTAGLITLENIIEEIVGEIQDEYDTEPLLYRKIDDNTLLVNAKIDMDELNKLLDVPLPTGENYESLGGFIFNLTGYVPEEKEVLKYNDYSFVIEKIERNRIIQVRIIKEIS
jgi:putative hemolysin